VARYVMQEVLGRTVHKRFADSHWVWGNLLCTAVVTFAWAYLIYTGNISTLWPLFGTGNQLLATIALAVCTTFLVNMGKARYAFITAVPLVFVGTITLSAGVLSIQNIFWPMTRVPGMVFTGYLDSTLMTLFILGVILVVADAARRCWKTLHGEPVPEEAFGPPVIKDGPPARCC
jgi:carbon starvation protein